MSIIILIMCVPFLVWPVLWIREALAAQERERRVRAATNAELQPCIIAAARGGSAAHPPHRLPRRLVT